MNTVSLKEHDFALRMQSDAVLEYKAHMSKKRASLMLKRVFDILCSLILLILLSPVILIIAILIKLDSPGHVVFKQKRITKNAKPFYIYKFRTMVENAEALGTQVTVKHDARVTRVGRTLRKYRLDELLQLLNILKGEMSFVGTRPEVEKYVAAYSDEMFATLLLPAGVTSLSSIYYKDEERLLSESENADETYINEILPKKMEYNLAYLKNFTFVRDLKLMIMTVLAVCGKEYAKAEQKNEKELTHA